MKAVSPYLLLLLLIILQYPVNGTAEDIFPGITRKELKAQSDVLANSNHVKPLVPITKIKKGVQNGFHYESVTTFLPKFETSDFYKNVAGMDKIIDKRYFNLKPSSKDFQSSGYSHIIRKTHQNNQTTCTLVDNRFPVKITEDVFREEYDTNVVKMMAMSLRDLANRRPTKRVKTGTRTGTQYITASFYTTSETICAYLEEAQRHKEASILDTVQMSKTEFFITGIQLKRFAESAQKDEL